MSIEAVEAPSPPSEAPSKAPTKKPKRQTTSSLFRVVWRWHFYAGVIVSPVVILVALTGGIYVFGAEICDVANRQRLFVESTGRVAPYPELIASAEAAVPGGRASRIRTYADPWRTAMVWVKSPRDQQNAGESAGGPAGSDETSVYVDPYTATVQELGEGPLRLEAFFQAVRKFHRQLFIGTTGRILVELATTWTIFLFLSGVYLWWPRRREKIKGVWVPRLSAKPYTVLRDLHTTVGIYLLPVCLIIIITGLFYTLIWGKSFHLVSKQFFDAPAATEAAKEAEGDQEEVYAAPAFPLQKAVAKARSLYSDRDVTVTLPSGSADHYEVSAISDYARGTYGAMDSTRFKLHRASGVVFDVEHLSDNERYWWHTWVYPLHVGSVLGWGSKVIWLAACLILVALPFTGLWMWWKRRPRDKIGFPRRPPPGLVPLWVSGAILLLCLLLPLFGLSVVLILAGEWLVRAIRRRPVS